MWSRRELVTASSRCTDDVGSEASQDVLVAKHSLVSGCCVCFIQQKDQRQAKSGL